MELQQSVYLLTEIKLICVSSTLVNSDVQIRTGGHLQSALTALTFNGAAEFKMKAIQLAALGSSFV